MKNRLFVKILSVILVFATLFGMATVTASAASYTTGTYSIAASNGSNVRNGAGTGYSKVGASKYGTEFVVSKVSGSWGYTSSIQCTNGTRSGWVCLDYCTKRASSPTPASTYPTGEYSIAASNGSNVRSGAGTGYSKVGASKYGTRFVVTKVNGSWGYTSSIVCTNGTKGGWVCLDYCSYRGSASNTTTTAKPATTVSINGVPYYKQSDSRWKNVKIGTNTIGQIGCLVTCIAMVYSFKTGKTVYPHQVKNYLRFANNDLYWSSLSDVGLTSKSYNCGISNSMMQTIYNLLRQGKPVIIGASTANGGSQHWVVITGYKGSTSNFTTAGFTILDPGYQNCKTLKDFLANGSSADRTKIIRIVY